jgi:hypothetical protein
LPPGKGLLKDKDRGGRICGVSRRKPGYPLQFLGFTSGKASGISASIPCAASTVFESGAITVAAGTLETSTVSAGTLCAIGFELIRSGVAYPALQGEEVH